MEKYDLIVIGSGPGGYVAAIRGAQKGLSVACVEKAQTLGGVCLNIGCIPSKALLYSTEYYHKLKVQGQEHGIEMQNLNMNLTQMMQRKDKVVKSLVDGIDFLFKKNKVAWIKGEAKLLGQQRVAVGENIIEGKYIILATGSESIQLPFLPFDEKQIVSSTGALSLSKVPKKLLMVGAGVIGLELGSVYQRLGSSVEVVELMDRVTPNLDMEISKTILQLFQKSGMKFHLSSRVVDGQREGENVVLTVEGADKVQKKLSGDVVLVGIGRKPFSKGLGLQEAGVEVDKNGTVIVDSNFATSVKGIYAIGDLIGGMMLAHKASEEGIAAVDLIMGERVQVNYLAIANVMYTWPEVACVGMTEQDAKEAGLSLIIGKASFRANPRARCTGDAEGIVKVIGEKASDRLIGLHIVGPNASEMIGEGVLAIEKKMTIKELAFSSHAHPTCSESIKEACLAAHGQAIHF